MDLISSALPQLSDEELNSIDYHVKLEQKIREKDQQEKERNVWTLKLKNALPYLDWSVQVLRVSFSKETFSHLPTCNNWTVCLHNWNTGVTLRCSRWQLKDNAGPKGKYYVRMFAFTLGLNGPSKHIGIWNKDFDSRRTSGFTIDEPELVKQNQWMSPFLENPMFVFSVFE